MKRRLVLPLLLAGLILICFALTQLQPVVVQGLGSVDGSFGLRPMSHDCAGWKIPGEELAWLPEGSTAGRLFLFTFRYTVPAEPAGRMFCLGQDLWYGE